MMFREVISLVENAFFPIDEELFLADAVAGPIKSHVDGFGAFLLNGVIGDAGGCAVVRL